MSLNLLVPLDRRFPKFKALNVPIDRGILLSDGYRLLGDSITTFGVAMMLLMPFLLVPFVPDTFALVFLKCGASFIGGMLGSFVKRRLGMPRGSFLPFVDHGDYMLMTGLVFYISGLESLPVILLALLGTYLIHPLVCVIGYTIKVKDQAF